MYVALQWKEEEDLAEFVYKSQLRSYALVGDDEWPEIREYWLDEFGRGLNLRNENAYMCHKVA